MGTKPTSIDPGAGHMAPQAMQAILQFVFDEVQRATQLRQFPATDSDPSMISRFRLKEL
jgi:hypothetical protein